MANPFGEQLFNPSPAYGEIARMKELASEAPISGAPIPGAGTTTKPTAGSAPVPAGPMMIPFAAAPSGAEYYQRLANTWRALAASPGASEEVKALARTSRQRVRTEYQLAQQGVA